MQSGIDGPTHGSTTSVVYAALEWRWILEIALECFLCPLPLRRTVHCPIYRIHFWWSVPRSLLGSVQDRGPPLAYCAHDSVREYLLPFVRTVYDDSFFGT